MNKKKLLIFVSSFILSSTIGYSQALTGSAPADTYKDLIHANNSNAGVSTTSTPTHMYDGAGNPLPLWMGTKSLSIIGTDTSVAPLVVDSVTGQATNIAEFKVNNVMKFRITQAGSVFDASTISASNFKTADTTAAIDNGFRLGSGRTIQWSNAAAYTATNDLHLFRYNDGSNTYLALGDGAGTAVGDITGRLAVGAGTAAAPSLAIIDVGGDVNNGFHSVDTNNFGASVAGTERIRFSTAGLHGTSSNGPYVLSEASSTTNPTLVGDRADVDSGLSGGAAGNDGQTSIISDGVEIIQVNGSGMELKTGSLTLPVVNRDITLPASAAGVGATAPVATTIATYRALSFDADAEVAFVNVELPDDYTGAGDCTLKTYWCSESADVIADTETVVFDIEYRSVDYDNAGETYDEGTVATGTVTYTQSGAGTDKECFESDITLDYDGANQPIAAGDVIGIKFNRDVTTDTYSGDAHVVRWEIRYPSNGVPNHL